MNVRTAESTRVDSGTIFTAGWVVDINGTPVLRVDIVGNGRGYAWLRRGPGQRAGRQGGLDGTGHGRKGRHQRRRPALARQFGEVGGAALVLQMLGRQTDQVEQDDALSGQRNLRVRRGHVGAEPARREPDVPPMLAALLSRRPLPPIARQSLAGLRPAHLHRPPSFTRQHHSHEPPVLSC